MLSSELELSTHPIHRRKSHWPALINTEYLPLFRSFRLKAPSGCFQSGGASERLWRCLGEISEWLAHFACVGKVNKPKWFSWAPLVPVFFGCLPMIPKGQEGRLGLGATTCTSDGCYCLTVASKRRGDEKTRNAGKRPRKQPETGRCQNSESCKGTQISPRVVAFSPRFVASCLIQPY